MGKLNDLTAGNMRDILRRLSRLENASPLSSSSIGRGRMRFYDGSVLLIENGALQVTGTATISGVLDVSGRTNLKGQVSVTGPMTISGTTTITGNTSITGELVVTGPTTLDGITDIGGDTTITGDLDVNGPATVNGKMDIKGPTTISGKLDVTGAMATKGTLSVEGVTTLKNDLNVTTGGKIKAGNLEIEPANGGQINFSGGAIAVGSFGMLITHTNGVSLSSGTKPSGTQPNCYMDISGKVYRIE